MAVSQEMMCFLRFGELRDDTVDNFLIGDSSSDDGVLALVAYKK